MATHEESLWPAYKSLVSNTYHLRRAVSELPKYGRDPYEKETPKVALFGRDVYDDSPPPVNSLEYAQYWDTKDVIENSKESIKRIDNYWLQKGEDSVRYPATEVYKSTRGKVHKLFAPSRIAREPTEYWASYPYSAANPQLYSYAKRHWSHYDPLYEKFVTRDLSHNPKPRKYEVRYDLKPIQDWRLDYPYTAPPHIDYFARHAKAYY